MRWKRHGYSQESSGRGAGGGDFRGGTALEEEANQAVERKGAGAEEEDDDGGEQEEEGVGGDEAVGIAEDVFHGIGAGGDVGDNHRKDEGDGDDAGAEAKQKKKTAETFGAAGEIYVEGGKRDAEALKKCSDLGDMGQLTHAGDVKLPAPIEADGEKKERLDPCGGGDDPPVGDRGETEERISIHGMLTV